MDFLSYLSVSENRLPLFQGRESWRRGTRGAYPNVKARLKLRVTPGYMERQAGQRDRQCEIVHIVILVGSLLSEKVRSACLSGLVL